MNKFEFSYADLQRPRVTWGSWQHGAVATVLTVVLTCQLLGWL